MMFVDMPQHKPAVAVAAVKILVWADGHIMMNRQTGDHVNARFEAVCRSMQNHVITPHAICLHVSQVIRPRRMSINKIEQFCPIRLHEEQLTTINTK